MKHETLRRIWETLLCCAMGAVIALAFAYSLPG
jgi:uncharacterized membrane protein YgaE (UPF0421/DUF939 family)